MAKYTIVESSRNHITLRITESSLKKLVRNWLSIEPEVPPDEDDAESIWEKLGGFWDEVKSRNPLWIPFKLGVGDVDEIQEENRPAHIEGAA